MGVSMKTCRETAGFVRGLLEFLLLCTLAAFLLYPCESFAAGTMIDLGTLPGGATPLALGSSASGINNAGQVVGSSSISSGTMHAFLYSNGTMTNLGTLVPGGTESEASGINDAGQVAGFSITLSGHTHAFLYSKGTMTDIGTLGGGASFALGINNVGQVVGYSSTSFDLHLHAFLYSNRTMTDLGILPGGDYSQACAINDAGQVVGVATTSSASHAFLYSNGTMTDLGTLPGGRQSGAYGINNAGQVVGSSSISSDTMHAFLYSNGTMTDLGTLPGGDYSEAYGINNAGQVVGRATTSSGTMHAFLYSNGTMTDIGTLPGGTASEAYGINNAGQVVGQSGQNPNSPLDTNSWMHAFLYTPATPPLTLDELSALFPSAWNYVGLYDSIESIFSVVSNCWNNPNYQPPSYVGSQVCTPIRAGISFFDDPIVTYHGQTFFTPWVDGKWDDLINNTPSKFNTVFQGFPESLDKFEAISYPDLANTPFCGTSNLKSYFFTYTAKTDTYGSATTWNEWVNYLKSITTKYNRPIDTLTIFSHGAPGQVLMSDAFRLLNDPITEQAVQQLRSNPNGSGILSANATILLFSCNVGQGSVGQAFVKNLANWTGATVYANTQATGYSNVPGSLQDWSLDVIGVPDNYSFTQPFTAPVSASYATTLMIPGGAVVKVGANALGADGTVTITNVSKQLPSMGVNLGSYGLINAYDISFSGQNVCSIVNGASISITLPLNTTATLNTNHIVVKYWDSASSMWSSSGITNVQINTAGPSVTFNTSHTSLFAALQSPVGDLNNDGVVNCVDIAIVKASFGKKLGQAGYDPRADVNNDGVVDVRDLAVVSQHLPAGTKCP